MRIFKLRDPNQQERSKYGEILTVDLSYFSGKNDELVCAYLWISFSSKKENLGGHEGVCSRLTAIPCWGYYLVDFKVADIHIPS